jgi:hypothetical protein
VFICVVFYVSCWCVLLVFRSDCKVFGCISSKSEQNWCFELVDGYLAFELVLTCGVYYYIIIHILLLYIIHILYYLYTIFFHILLPLPLFLPFLNHPPLIFSSSSLPSSSFLILSFILYLSVLGYGYLYSITYSFPSPQQFDPAQIIGGMSRVV